MTAGFIATRLVGHEINHGRAALDAAHDDRSESTQ
jgi:hypothetical protein